MKPWVIASLLLSLQLVASAAEPAKPAAGKPVSHVRAAAVSELRGNDHVFALMMESYRQIQELMIEGDYDKRLKLAQQITSPAERDRLVRLALEERQQRLAKLQQTLEGFQSAYGSSRKEDERKTGQTVPSTASPETAATELKSFVPFQPKDFRVENGPSELVPAAAQMLYAPPSR